MNIILLIPKLVGNFREIPDLWTVDYKLLFTFFVLTSSQVSHEWNGLPLFHSSQFGYFDPFGHLNTARRYSVTSNKIIHAHVLGTLDKGVHTLLWGRKDLRKR